ncbi:Tumor suppressor p53-binding protein 1 [Armadillidium nasatum]|uniref:Tumor suppressor p53-binding protein 1 n=1 Tax=Armadillidium nasatum TaxID=96803 RepID=A0A5N5SXB3_9CRUS|nr:Tumor suppressor p53-binding protein 1 [Armadillidium nasatum]
MLFLKACFGKFLCSLYEELLTFYNWISKYKRTTEGFYGIFYSYFKSLPLKVFKDIYKQRNNDGPLHDPIIDTLEESDEASPRQEEEQQHSDNAHMESFNGDSLPTTGSPFKKGYGAGSLGEASVDSLVDEPLPIESVHLSPFRIETIHNSPLSGRQKDSHTFSVSVPDSLPPHVMELDSPEHYGDKMDEPFESEFCVEKVPPTGKVSEDEPFLIGGPTKSFPEEASDEAAPLQESLASILVPTQEFQKFSFILIFSISAPWEYHSYEFIYYFSFNFELISSFYPFIFLYKRIYYCFIIRKQKSDPSLEEKQSQASPKGSLDISSQADMFESQVETRSQPSSPASNLQTGAKEDFQRQSHQLSLKLSKDLPKETESCKDFEEAPTVAGSLSPPSDVQGYSQNSPLPSLGIKRILSSAESSSPVKRKRDSLEEISSDRKIIKKDRKELELEGESGRKQEGWVSAREKPEEADSDIEILDSESFSSANQSVEVVFDKKSVLCDTTETVESQDLKLLLTGATQPEEEIRDVAHQGVDKESSSSQSPSLLSLPDSVSLTCNEHVSSSFLEENPSSGGGENTLQPTQVELICADREAASTQHTSQPKSQKSIDPYGSSEIQSSDPAVSYPQFHAPSQIGDGSYGGVEEEEESVFVKAVRAAEKKKEQTRKLEIERNKTKVKEHTTNSSDNNKNNIHKSNVRAGDSDDEQAKQKDSDILSDKNPKPKVSSSTPNVSGRGNISPDSLKDEPVSDISKTNSVNSLISLTSQNSNHVQSKMDTLEIESDDIHNAKDLMNSGWLNLGQRKFTLPTFECWENPSTKERVFSIVGADGVIKENTPFSVLIRYATISKSGSREIRISDISSLSKSTTSSGYLADRSASLSNPEGSVKHESTRLSNASVCVISPPQSDPHSTVKSTSDPKAKKDDEIFVYPQPRSFPPQPESVACKSSSVYVTTDGEEIKRPYDISLTETSSSDSNRVPRSRGRPRGRARGRGKGRGTEKVLIPPPITEEVKSGSSQSDSLSEKDSEYGEKFLSLLPEFLQQKLRNSQIPLTEDEEEIFILQKKQIIEKDQKNQFDQVCTKVRMAEIKQGLLVFARYFDNNYYSAIIKGPAKEDRWRVQYNLDDLENDKRLLKKMAPPPQPRKADYTLDTTDEGSTSKKQETVKTKRIPTAFSDTSSTESEFYYSAIEETPKSGRKKAPKKSPASLKTPRSNTTKKQLLKHLIVETTDTTEEQAKSSLLPLEKIGDEPIKYPPKKSKSSPVSKTPRKKIPKETQKVSSKSKESLLNPVVELIQLQEVKSSPRSVSKKRGRRPGSATKNPKKELKLEEGNDTSDEDVTGEIDPSLGPLPPPDCQIFKGYTILITHAINVQKVAKKTDDVNGPLPMKKEYLTKQIIAGGGRVVETFQEAYHELHQFLQTKKTLSKDDISNKGGKKNSFTTLPASESPSRVLCVSNDCCRTAKYIQCLTVGIPLVNMNWVITSINLNQCLNWSNYLLPAGYSIITGYNIEQIFGFKNISPNVGRVTEVVKDEKVFLASSSNPEFGELWHHLLTVANAAVFKMPPKGGNLQRLIDRKTDFVIADNTIPEQELRRAQELNVPVVSSEWFIQSLIVGYKLPFDVQPQFKYDYKAPSSDPSGSQDNQSEEDLDSER